MADPVRNFAITTVATAPSPATSGTTLEPGDASLFPDPDADGAFNVVVWPSNTQPLMSNAEIVRVTALAGGVWTIDREEEGTSARAIVAGDQVILGPTAKSAKDPPLNWETEGDPLPETVIARTSQDNGAGYAILIVRGIIGGQASDLFRVETESFGTHVSINEFGTVRIGAPLDPDEDSFWVETEDGETISVDKEQGISKLQVWHYFMVNANDEPVDSAIQNSTAVMWYDDSAGAAKVKFKAKESDGTVRTGEVALS